MPFLREHSRQWLVNDFRLFDGNKMQGSIGRIQLIDWALYIHHSFLY